LFTGLFVRVPAMKKTKSKAPAKRVPKTPANGKPVDLDRLRREIANLVGGRAVSMVGTTIDEVDKGHYAAMKYLFELIGLYPGNSEAAVAEDDGVLAKTLLRRLGLPEEAQADDAVTKGIEARKAESGERGKDAVE